MTEFLQQINWIDILVVILLIRSSYVGFTKGFGWEFFRFLGYICAVIVSIYYYEFASQWISDYLPGVYSFSSLISFTSIYVIILFIFRLVNLVIEKIIKIEVFSTLERVGGLVLGFGRGAILASLLLITMVFTPVPYFEKSVKERSSIGQAVLNVAPFLYEKISILFPGLKLAQRNEGLIKLTGFRERSYIIQKEKAETSAKKDTKNRDKARPKKGVLKGDAGY